MALKVREVGTVGGNEDIKTCRAELRTSTFLLLAVAAHVGVVAVERPRGGVGAAAVILGVQSVDGDVDEMEDHLTAVHVSVRVLRTFVHTEHVT